MKTLWYNFIRLIIKLGLFFYSKRIRVFGRKNIPKKGAVLFTVNHPNGLIDPLIVTTSMLRKNHYLVRAAAFKNSFIKKLLSSLNLMPIYRIRDGASNLGRNQEIFNQCFEIFKKGETLMIFPEGSHHQKRTIRPLSKGFTRIVFGAIDKYPDLKISIVPVGITYQNIAHYPAKVSVSFGEPISANDFYILQDKKEAVIQLKTKVREQLKKLTVHITDDENYESILKKLNEAQVDFTKVGFVKSLIASSKYPKKKTAKLNFIRPLFFLIVLNNLFPFIIWKVVSKRVDEIEFVDTFRFVISIVSFPLFMGIQTWIISSFWDWEIAKIYFFTSIIVIFLYVKFSSTNTRS